MLVGAVAVVTAAASTSPAAACPLAGTCERPLLEFRAGFEIAPRTLPVGKPAPVAFGAGARISTATGTHPSALREAVVDVDRDVVFDVDGLPACGYRRLASRESDAARRDCRRAIVGWGTAVFLLTYPENKPILLKTDVTLFNGGARGRATRLFLHGFLPIPRPEAVVAPVGLEPALGGGSGLHATIAIPRVSDGHGSLVDLTLTVRRSFRAEDGTKNSFLSARCPDGSFEVTMPKLVFTNEIGTPGVAPQTLLKDSALVPCAPERSR